MRGLAGLIVGCSLGALATCAAGGEVQAPADGSGAGLRILQVTLDSGSRMRGRPTPSTLAYQSSVGRIEVPWASVSELSHPQCAGTWILRLGATTTLRGKPAMQTLAVSNAIGHYRLSTECIQRIEVLAASSTGTTHAAGSSEPILPATPRQAIVELSDSTRIIGRPRGPGTGIEIPELAGESVTWSHLRSIARIPDRGVFHAVLVNDDLLVGKAGTANLPIESTIGPLVLPWDRIQRITFADPEPQPGQQAR